MNRLVSAAVAAALLASIAPSRPQSCPPYGSGELPPDIVPGDIQKYLLPGDIAKASGVCGQDYAVDDADASYMASLLGSSVGDGVYDANADLDLDGDVDASDQAAFQEILAASPPYAVFESSEEQCGGSVLVVPPGEDCTLGPGYHHFDLVLMRGTLYLTGDTVLRGDYRVHISGRVEMLDLDGDPGEPGLDAPSLTLISVYDIVFTDGEINLAGGAGGSVTSGIPASGGRGGRLTAFGRRVAFGPLATVQTGGGSAGDWTDPIAGGAGLRSGHAGSIRAYGLADVVVGNLYANGGDSALRTGSGGRAGNVDLRSLGRDLIVEGEIQANGGNGASIAWAATLGTGLDGWRGADGGFVTLRSARDLDAGSRIEASGGDGGGGDQAGCPALEHGGDGKDGGNAGKIALVAERDVRVLGTLSTGPGAGGLSGPATGAITCTYADYVPRDGGDAGSAGVHLGDIDGFGPAPPPSPSLVGVSGPTTTFPHAFRSPIKTYPQSILVHAGQNALLEYVSLEAPGASGGAAGYGSTSPHTPTVKDPCIARDVGKDGGNGGDAGHGSDGGSIRVEAPRVEVLGTLYALADGGTGGTAGDAGNGKLGHPPGAPGLAGLFGANGNGGSIEILSTCDGGAEKLVLSYASLEFSSRGGGDNFGPLGAGYGGVGGDGIAVTAGTAATPGAHGPPGGAGGLVTLSCADRSLLDAVTADSSWGLLAWLGGGPGYDAGSGQDGGKGSAFDDCEAPIPCGCDCSPGGDASTSGNGGNGGAGGELLFLASADVGAVHPPAWVTVYGLGGDGGDSYLGRDGGKGGQYGAQGGECHDCGKEDHCDDGTDSPEGIPGAGGAAAMVTLPASFPFDDQTGTGDPGVLHP